MTRTPDDFYVGYLPAPESIRRFVRIVVAIVLLIVAGAAVVIASMQREPGSGVWHDSQYQTFEGGILAQPYGMLLIAGQPHLLVTEAKAGLTDRVRSLHGQKVKLRGTLLERDGRRLIAVPDAADAIQPGGHATFDPPVNQTGPMVRLVGEIIDPKCYIGAMKPGGGKTHKACAALCLRGGIPPMFVTRNPDGSESYHLIVGQEPEALLEACIRYVGEPVSISGRTGALGDLATIEFHPDQIARLE